MTAHAPDLLEVPAPGRVLGRPVLRSEDRALLTGAARYTDDVPCEGALHGVFVRSPIAHALVGSVDAGEARAMPGVVGVFTAGDMGGLRMPPVEDSPEVFARPLLAIGRVRFAGEPVAVVVARTRAQAMDAADAVAVDYEPLAPVIDPEAALEPGAPVLFQAHGSNLAIRADDVAEDPNALEGADIVVRARFVNQRVAPVPMEPNGALAIAGAEPSVTLWASVQAPHDTRRIVAQVLGLDPAQVRVRTATVGGGFGGKIPTYPEHVVIAWLARHLGTPVRWSETRSENMVAMTHGRGQVQHVELGATVDGRVLGLRVFVIQDIGAYASEAATLPPLTGLMASGPYRIPRIDFHAVSVVTTTTPVGAYRGAGRPEATFLLERALDMLAAELGIDPAEIRRRNFIPPGAFPYRTPTGANYDSGDPGRALEIALRAAGYSGLRQEQAARAGRGDTWQLGIGIGSYVEVTGWGSEFASVEAGDQGTFTVLTGTSPHGQGHETAWAQIVADTLGVSFDAVTVRHSDTLFVPRGGGTMGSRSLQVGGSAVFRASMALLDKARRLAAHLLAVNEGDVRRFDGRIGVREAPGLSLSWGELAVAAADPSSLPPGMEAGLRAQTDFEMEDSTYPSGVHVAVVEVDTETGKAKLVRHVAVDDCGRRINPMLVEGQVHGGIAQGAAQALFESFVYDEAGNPQTSSLATYAMPSAADLPSFVTVPLATPTDRNPLRAKGVGEGGTIGAGPAVQNAVIDALSHLGVRHIDMPMSPDRVWQAITDARRGVPGGHEKGGWHGTAGPERPDSGDRHAHAERWVDRRGVPPKIR
ncbi:MAG: xanthine dehydrogenase family protein molybdopterin-binding subunit [Candidatus Dormibacteraeota bacterium]|nr:xanthine dehydrogenase family protein molybdopterin-binding subunit [Candidatus Dormibacteraeota bacterium]MBO0761470.1 xanthine dehydrogenase family protein molybdopterin-binding subunit [Candidatus Dormibacteraeota bacterium]